VAGKNEKKKPKQAERLSVAIEPDLLARIRAVKKAGGEFNVSEVCRLAILDGLKNVDFGPVEVVKLVANPTPKSKREWIRNGKTGD
jgi:hypothetical protein